MSKWLSDGIVEEAGRRIYESQQLRLSYQTTFAAKRPWRSDDVPEKFWDSYVEDARAALSLTSLSQRIDRQSPGLVFDGFVLRFDLKATEVEPTFVADVEYRDASE